jgi:DNA-binding NtrC family response regulator
MLTRVLLALDDPQLRGLLVNALAAPDLLAEAPTGEGLLWERIIRNSADVFVLSLDLIPTPAADRVAFLRELPESPAVVVISPTDGAEEQARLLAAGCDGVLYRGLSEQAMVGAVNALLERRADSDRLRARTGPDLAQASLSDFISQSPAMTAFMDVVKRVVPSNSSLLILGETGVGKERLARAIHAEGRRSNGPFVAVNCGALPEALLESELFGHERGAFTGASRQRRGRFELAHDGTVFLDEIGEMPYHLQVKLLRVLQEREVHPIGSERPIRVDVRLMAASNRNLEEAAESGSFRRDLYYRLSVVTLTIPPLRERQEDIPELVQSYISYLQDQIGCDVSGITDAALDALVDYGWPGNVRELINVVERAMLLSDGRLITLSSLPEAVRGRRAPEARSTGRQQPLDVTEKGVPARWLKLPLRKVRREVVDRAEKAYLTELLRETEGSVGETARRAGIVPRSLYDKMKKHGLAKEDFRG